MPTPTPPDRLPRLKSALAQFKAREYATQQALADLYGVTPSRFSTLVRDKFDSFPPKKMDGKQATYLGRKAVQAMLAYIEKDSLKEQARAERDQAILGHAKKEGAKASKRGKNAGPPPPLLTAVELDRLASAQMKIFRMMREAGKLVPIDPVRHSMRQALIIFTSGISNLVNIIDPKGDLDPKRRAAIEHKQREIIIKARDEFAAWLGSDDD